MEVSTASERAIASQRMVLELLLSGYAGGARSPSRPNFSIGWMKLQVGASRFAPRSKVAGDLSHPAIAVNLDACIQCTRCVRACREVQVNDVIGYAFRGDHSKIVFDLDDPMGISTCVACGECVQACPTGALMPARGVGMEVPDKAVDSVCPFCGVGCQLTYFVKDNRILYVNGKDGPANEGRLCVKGRYGFDYAHHKHRLTKPLVRREGAPKSAGFTMDPDRVHEIFREATWDEALDLAAGRLKEIRDRLGAGALAGFGSAKGINEEAYLFQKLVRTGFRWQQRRPLHAAVPRLVGRGAARGHRIGRGVEPGDGRDEGRGHLRHRREPDGEPPGGRDMDQERRGERNEADRCRPAPDRAHPAMPPTVLQFKADTDVALLNAMMHTIVHEGLVDQAFIRKPHHRLRGAQAERRGLQSRGDGARLRHPR